MKVNGLVGLCVLWSLAEAGSAQAGNIKGTVRLTSPADAGRMVVYVESVPEGTFIPFDRSFHLSQKGAQFNPAVLPVVKGAEVDLTNDDWIAHNVFSDSEGASFDVGVYGAQTRKVIPFDKLGAVDVRCSIHPHMKGVILVLQNPFFSRPDTGGAFFIQNIPEGNYQLKVYRPAAPPGSRSVKVPRRGTVNVVL